MTLQAANHSPLDLAVSGAGTRTGASHDAAGKLRSFEGLRGVLALLVCIGHLGLNTVAAGAGLHVRFELAVDVFFALSGFVLAKTYYFNRRSFSQLLASRIARLYPLHLLTAVWCLLLAINANETIDWMLFLQTSMLVHNIGLPPNHWGFNFPSWSISVEMAASLLCCVLLRNPSGKTAAAALVVALCLSGLIGASRLGAASNIWIVFNVGLLSGLAGFGVGAAAYLTSLRLRKQLERRRRLAQATSLCLVPFFLLPPIFSQPGLAALASVAFAVTIYACLLLLSANDDATLLSSRPLVFLGGISYSIYLLHIPVYSTLAQLLPFDLVRGVTGKPLVLATILFLSIISYHLLEIKLKAWILKWVGHGDGRSASTAAIVNRTR